MARIGTVDERYQSYNVEMVEVTGGRFWKPYAAKPEASPSTTPASPPSGSDAPAGLSRDLFQYRPPVDLRNARLRKLAAGLGPAYVRVSGTWANTTYFPESDKAPDAPPTGFRGVLTCQQWKGAVDFARAVDARIVTSFATGPGTRDAAGLWTPLGRQVWLNGTDLTLGSNDDLPRLAGVPAAAGDVTLEPATITFLAVPGAANSSCR